MGEVLGPLVDEVLRRARDVGAQGTSREQVRRFLAHAEGLVAIGLHAHIETFTFINTPTRLVYDLAGISPRIGDVLTVRVDGRYLTKTAFKDFAAQSVSWFRDVGPEFLAWAPLARDLLVLWPGGNGRLSTITVKATAMPLVPDETYIGSDLDTLTVDARWTSYVLDWVEVLMLLRSRRYDALKPALERLKEARMAAVSGVLV